MRGDVTVYSSKNIIKYARGGTSKKNTGASQKSTSSASAKSSDGSKKSSRSSILCSGAKAIGLFK